MSRPATKPRRAPKLAVQLLEDRITPVIGAYDVNQVPDSGSFDGVARLNNGTAALLSNARFVLTAAHVENQGGTADPRFELDGPGNTQRIIRTPGAGFVRHPSYPANVGGYDNFDIGIMPLAELAPLTAERWDLYTGSDELGRVGRLVGFGGTGTGTSGHSTDIWDGQSGESNTNYELVRFTVTGGPTGGTFTVKNALNPAGQTVPFNVTAAGLQAALNGLLEVWNPRVRLVGDTDFNGLIDDFNNPHRGSFEAVFPNTFDAEHALDDLTVTHGLTGGANPGVVVERLLDGGSNRIRTTGLQGVSVASPNGMLLFTDFDNGSAAFDTLNDGTGQGGNEGHGTWGDSGSPLFIGGKIAGVLEGLYGTVEGMSSKGGADKAGGTGDWGEIDSWARVSSHLQFLNAQMAGSFDLVLNMANQLPGDDGIDDHVAVRRVGDRLTISFDGEQVYSESVGLIKSVTIKGSKDAETIDVSDLDLPVTVTVRGGGGDDTVIVNGTTAKTVSVNGEAGNDTVEVRGVEAGSTVFVFGSDDTDTVSVGDGDLDTNVRGDVRVLGGGENVTVNLFDLFDAGADAYRLDAGELTKPSLTGDIEFNNVAAVKLYANGSGNVVRVAGTFAGTDYLVHAGDGIDTVYVGDGNAAAQIDGDVSVVGGTGADTLVLDAEDGPAGGMYTVHGSSVLATGMAGDVEHLSFARVAVRGTGGADEFRQGFLAAGTDVEFDGRGGKDRLVLNAVPINEVTFHGGDGADVAELVGSNGVDDVTLRGNALDFAAGGSVTLYSVEDASIDTRGGVDQIAFAGTPNVNEAVHLYGDAAANAGRWVNGGFAVRFTNTELTAAAGNADDADTLTFHGTVADDWFRADLTANGNLFDPLYRLTTTGGEHRLTLVDATGFDRVALDGGNGSDLFAVRVSPDAPTSRALHVNGGSPLSREVDRLQVEYAGPPEVASKMPSGPRSGLVRVQYPLRRVFDLTYEETEEVELLPQS